MTKLVVGLGNIGKEFEGTVHNIGFIVIDAVAKNFNINFKNKACSSLIAEFNVNSEKVILAKPTTYMNLSGLAVKSLCKKYGVDSKKDLLIISDDIDLPVSKIRLREKGTAGTHNGLRNIVKELASTEFCRLRVGVGKPDNQALVDFVLSKIHKSEQIREGLEKAYRACTMFVEGQSFDSIMREFN